MQNINIVNDILDNWEYYGFPTTIAQDFVFSLIITICGGKIGPYNGHRDGYNGLDINIDVQHQYKEFYNKPLPNKYKYLVDDFSMKMNLL